MKTSAFFIAGIGLALSLAAGHASAQPSGSQRSDPKPTDWEQMQKFSKEMAERQKQMQEDMAKQQKEMFENLGKSKPFLQKQDQGSKPPGTGLPAATTKSQDPAPRQYSPRARSQAASTPRAAQPAMPERKPQAAPAAPAKPPCVYKAVMSNDEIAACR